MVVPTVHRGRYTDQAVGYEEGPGGHDWACWDLMIQRVLEWLPLRHRPTK